ncbi:TlpA family protein disulfide reductase [Paractinoplanes rishiriensis]|uniref:Thioredoxin domain-containing protein n=1 Tax=Paractinoplanes rishiriensis TaxID=1050105 RepID=A0A919MR38_9ACTN|nr:thioredoxin family protein [Actinoplanes rishiriensis]GIE96801.1 hypothetical protein Ari01nite_42660 [Actinoplanes rishiriensis]
MDWVGVLMVVVVLIMGVMAGLLRRRMDGKFRDVAEAKNQLAQFVENRDKSPEAAATAANAASNAAAAAVPAPAGRPAKPRALHLVRDDEAAPSSGREGAAGSGREGAAGSGRDGAEGSGRDGAEGSGVIPDATEEPGVVESPAAGDDRLDPGLLERLGVRPAQATILQFSTAFCAPCRAVRRISTEVADLLPSVQHVEVDAESHLDEVRALNIWRTPTLLLLDADGRVSKRATGVPSKPQLIAALADILPAADS